MEDLNCARRSSCGAAGARTPGWADAETRGFLERPGYSTSFAKVLQVTVIIAMAVAAIKVAWILVFQA